MGPENPALADKSGLFSPVKSPNRWGKNPIRGEFSRAKTRVELTDWFSRKPLHFDSHTKYALISVSVSTLAQLLHSMSVQGDLEYG
jgi:hypothetical protein